MEEPMQIQTEIIEDVVLLVEQIKQMSLPEILDEQIERHWKEKGLSWGWTISIWLVHIISQGDHRKLEVTGMGARAAYYSRIGNRLSYQGYRFYR